MRVARVGSLTIGLVLLSVLLASAAITIKYLVGAPTTLLTTGLNSLANNTCSSVSANYDNRIGQTGDGATVCRMEFNGTFASAPTANTAVTGWFLKTVDGTNFEDWPSTCSNFGRPPDYVLPVTAGQTTTRVAVDVPCPAERFRVGVRNDGTGQSMAASGNTVKVLPIYQQGN